METTIKLNMVDICSIQLGDHFNTLVGNYITISKAINIDESLPNDLKKNHKYIEGVQRKYYGLIEALGNGGLFKNDMKIIDLGCGLCTTLYNIHLQFKHYGFNANFYGIEHNKELLDIFNNYLNKLWDGKKPILFNDDIFSHQLNNYDLILSYQPMKIDYIGEMYDKVFKEMKPNSIFYEYNYDDCVNILLDVANKNNMEQRGLLFGGQKQNLFIKR